MHLGFRLLFHLGFRVVCLGFFWCSFFLYAPVSTRSSYSGTKPLSISKYVRDLELRMEAALVAGFWFRGGS